MHTAHKSGARTCSQADKSPVIPPPFLLLPLVPVSSLPPPSPPLSSLTTEQGQLENIPCSFLAQPRHSPGPLIKHKPSSFFCLFLPLFLSLSPSLHCHLLPSAWHPLPPLSHPPFLFLPATSFHQFAHTSPFYSTPARSFIPRPLRLFVMVEVWYSHWDSPQSQSVQSGGLVILLCWC